MRIGTAINVATKVMMSVPTIAGPMPGPISRARTGMSLVRNDQLIEPAPFWMTTKKTKTNGTRTSASDAAISVLMMALLVVRQVRLDARPADSAVSRVGEAPVG